MTHSQIEEPKRKTATDVLEGSKRLTVIQSQQCTHKAFRTVDAANSHRTYPREISDKSNSHGFVSLRHRLLICPSKLEISNTFPVFCLRFRTENGSNPIELVTILRGSGLIHCWCGVGGRIQNPDYVNDPLEPLSTTRENVELVRWLRLSEI
jgi:hypothetical protein